MTSRAAEAEQTWELVKAELETSELLAACGFTGPLMETRRVAHAINHGILAGLGREGECCG